ncbi:MAG: hypothetical protein H0X34_07450 [Chthoniobacterales bacterium]|nr:hypothetical protein [Chthoniobacterales bacterium]
MLPAFSDDGFLPGGIHWAEWSEIASRFAGNSHREALLYGLARAVGCLRMAGCTAVFIDGSFVTQKEHPADFDVCWLVDGVDLGALRKIEPAFFSFNNLRALQKAKFGGELFPAGGAAETTSPFRTFLEFFQTDKLSGLRKGIVGYRPANK